MISELITESLVASIQKSMPNYLICKREHSQKSTCCNIQKSRSHRSSDLLHPVYAGHTVCIYHVGGGQ